MLPNYDAKAVAEVLGLAFLRGSEDRAAFPPSTGRKGSAKPARDASNPDFLIEVNDATLLVVESKAEDGWAPFGRAKASSPRRFASKGRLSTPSSVVIEKAVEKGLPREALRHVAEWLAGGDKTKISALEWGVVPKTTLERREGKLSPRESERTERIARLFVHARRAFGSEAEAREFMTTSHPELDGRSPIEAAKTISAPVVPSRS